MSDFDNEKTGGQNNFLIIFVNLSLVCINFKIIDFDYSVTRFIRISAHNAFNSEHKLLNSKRL